MTAPCGVFACCLRGGLAGTNKKKKPASKPVDHCLLSRLHPLVGLAALVAPVPKITKSSLGDCECVVPRPGRYTSGRRAFISPSRNRRPLEFPKKAPTCAWNVPAHCSNLRSIRGLERKCCVTRSEVSVERGSGFDDAQHRRLGQRGVEASRPASRENVVG